MILQWRAMIHSSERAQNFNYAIRNVVRPAEALERRGRRVIYLNIGDPQSFGFRPPDFVIDAVNRALHDKFTGYSHSSGLPEAREAIARVFGLINERISSTDGSQPCCGCK